MNIPLNTIGRIEAGANKGWQVKVEPCSSDSENFLVLVSQDFSNLNAEEYDDWVEDYESLKQYFVESKWLITWS
ncbi:hypothetical protein [Vibrio sp. HB161653]|uniref:hypothetical protein n=1 Tax=Vibrio sp. HB161653 TaxID=3068274 RepID=UPI0027400946|nr:hypothetical protein [Vibrio sp. HB161653]MDP5255840.1 hypothetical protein [Vibrio sp. HB161653]